MLAQRIMYDHQAFGTQYSGVSRYYYELIRRIARRSDMSVSAFQGIHINHYPIRACLNGANRCTGLKVPSIPRTLRVRSLINRHWFRHFSNGLSGLCDIYHPTYYYTYKGRSLLRRHSKLVVTVYDMIHEIYYARQEPNNATLAHKKAMVKEADAILAISHKTKSDLVEILGVDPRKIFVTPLATSMPNPVSSRKLPLKSGRPLLLYVGQRGDYKNFSTLLDAYLHGPDIRKCLDLVCFGGNAFTAEERDAIESNSATNQIHHVVGDDDLLQRLYQNAFTFVYPSKYEGFGIPLLEAMASGCPVITTRCGSIPEVAGNAAIYFDESDPESLQESIRVFMENDSIRTEKTQAGMLRAREFSWDKTAELTAEVYKSLR